MIKKFFLIAFLLVIFDNCLCSQTRRFLDNYRDYRDSIINITNKYLTVKGVELKPGLKMVDLLHRLESKGFKKTKDSKYTEEEYGIFDLRGIFYSHICTIKILPLKNDKTIVGMIGVEFPKENSFKILKEEYDELKSALSKKYSIYSCVESFDKEYVEHSSSDILKLQALSNNEATFQTKFYISDDPHSGLLGQVSLNISAITVDYSSYYYVSLVYCTPDDIYEQLTKGDDL